MWRWEKIDHVLATMATSLHKKFKLLTLKVAVRDLATLGARLGEIGSRFGGILLSYATLLNYCHRNMFHDVLWHSDSMNLHLVISRGLCCHSLIRFAGRFQSLYEYREAIAPLPGNWIA